MTSPSDSYSTDPTGLPPATSTQTLELSDGDRIDLRIAPVAKRIGDATLRMLAYGGSIPGPTLRVTQGSTLTVDVRNDSDDRATIHWHGLRLDNRSDGTTETQQPMPIGGAFRYQLAFPDPGVYWYHPHTREDYGQEMGLYGNIVVTPSEPDYWPPVHRELVLVLDDVLIEDGRIAPFSRRVTTHTAMGRFGNTLLVNGDTMPAFAARSGEVLRLYLTNTANTRVFKVALPGARMKLVGGDSGRYEHERFVDDIVISPSERVVVDVQLAAAGQLTLEHRTPKRTYPLATIAVGQDRAPALAADFATLRSNADLAAEREQLARYASAAPDKTIGFVAEMDMGTPELAAGETVVYTCPMHPQITSHEPGKCPLCKMKLLPTAQAKTPAAHSGHGAHGEHGGHHGGAADTSGIEWEDDMVELNRTTTPDNTRWKLVDKATGASGQAIDWRFRVGDRVKIRLVNEMDSDHPMHHPFHIHGAGRFLVLARDGVVEPNLVWKDTVLVPTGQVVDIMLEVTNPGRWMAHCHIAEHHESGMMFSFDVVR